MPPTGQDLFAELCWHSLGHPRLGGCSLLGLQPFESHSYLNGVA